MSDYERKTDRVYPPRDLDDKHQGIFRETLAILRRRKEPEFQRVTDIPLLEQYVRHLYIAASALARIHAREKAWEKWYADWATWSGDGGVDEPVKGWTALGAQKQTVQHPDVKTWRDGLHDANEVAKELLLPPRTRKQNEIESGAGDDAGKFGF